MKLLSLLVNCLGCIATINDQGWRNINGINPTTEVQRTSFDRFANRHIVDPGEFKTIRAGLVFHFIFQIFRNHGCEFGHGERAKQPN